VKDLFYFGAIGDDVADDTAAVQAALDSGCALSIPQGMFKITSPVVQTKVMTIVGEGEKSFIHGVFPTAQTGAWKVDLGSDFSRGLGYLAGFKIQSNCPCLYFDVSSSTANYISNWSIERLLLSNTAGGYSLVLNNPTSMNGFFCSNISHCILDGGMRLARLGDSVRIDHNTITGAGMGINLDAVIGATQVDIFQNNITTSREAIMAGNYLQNINIERNNIEQFNAVNPPDWIITLWGPAGITKPTIRGNCITVHHPFAGGLIAVAYTAGGLIDENELNGFATAVYLMSTVSGMRIGKRNVTTCPTLVTNQSASTIYE
jgi:hypothetical protein